MVVNSLALFVIQDLTCQLPEKWNFVAIKRLGYCLLVSIKIVQRKKDSPSLYARKVNHPINPKSPTNKIQLNTLLHEKIT